MVIETPDIYARHIQPYMARQRAAGRLDWIFNILDGRTEQDDVIARVDWDAPSNTGFLLLPDLNWDRKTVEGMHLLALVQRRDIWSLRDLRKKHVPWLKAMKRQILKAVAAHATTTMTGSLAPLDEDQLKCYIHYQPTYYHFHVHVVHVMLEAGTTQSVGKAFGLGNVIAQLERMEGGDDAGMHDVDLHYFVGEESELWRNCFGRLKKGEEVDLNGNGNV
jgi:m7GpppX diphosphatase